MEVEFLPPGMEYLDDAGCGPQKLPVCRKLQESLSGALMEEGIQKGLVGIDQRVELGRYGKDHMEIGSVDDFRFPSVNPEFLEERLAVGTVAVAAGIIVEVHVPAVGADGDIAAQLSGLAGHDGGSGFHLYRGGAERSGVHLPGVVKDLLNLEPMHCGHLPSCQRG